MVFLTQQQQQSI